MKRYSSTKQKIDKLGMRVYGTTYYPRIPVNDNDQFIFPKFGDRLDTLAHKYYGDTGFWWIIAKANGIKGKVALPTDEMIRIPSNISQIVENFKKINNIG